MRTKRMKQRHAKQEQAKQMLLALMQRLTQLPRALTLKPKLTSKLPLPVKGSGTGRGLVIPLIIVTAACKNRAVCCTFLFHYYHVHSVLILKQHWVKRTNKCWYASSSCCFVKLFTIHHEVEQANRTVWKCFNKFYITSCSTTKVHKAIPCMMMRRFHEVRYATPIKIMLWLDQVLRLEKLPAQSSSVPPRGEAN